MQTLFIPLFLLLFSCSNLLIPNPGKQSGKIRFCVVGDVGDGSSRQMNVAQAMMNSGCERLILLGDLIYPDGIRTEDDYVLHERFHKPYQSFRMIYLVMGNHDYQGKTDAWTKLAEKDDRIIHPANYFRERIHDICLFFLDTNFASDEYLYAKEVPWLRKAKSGCSYKVAFTHHPYSSSGLRHGNARDQVKKFMKEEIVGEFQALFSGHEHILSDEGTLKGTRQIISGAGGKVEKGHANGFVIYTLDLNRPSSSTIELISL